MSTGSKMGPIKAIIFDWGGVISQNGSPDEASENLAKKLNISVDAAKRLFKPQAEALKRGNISEKAFWEKVSLEYGKDIRIDQQDIWLAWDALQPTLKIKRYITELKTHKYKVAILSNTFPASYELIKQNGGYDVFDAIIASSEVGYAKPDPEIYEMTLRKLGLEGQQCLFIDDQLKCLNPAMQLFGMHTLLAQNPEQIVADVQKILANHQHAK